VVRFAPLFKCKRLPRAGKRRKTGNGRRRVGERPSSGLWPSRVGCLVSRPLRRPSGLGVGLSLLYELVARFRRRPQTSSLVPGVRGRAASSRSLDPRVEVLVASAIKEVYLRPERPRLIDLWRAVRAQCLSLGLKPPAYHTLQARVQQCDARVVDPRWVGVVKPEDFVRLVGELMAMLSWPDACGSTHLQQGSCGAHAYISRPLPLGSEAFGRLRRQERFELLDGVVKLLGTGPREEDQPRGDPNPFCCVYGPMSASGRRQFLERLQSWPERVRVKAMAAVACF